jgi:hypothetical protein
MANFRILIKGMVAAFKKRRLAGRLWTVNLIFSLFVVGPFFFLMLDHMSHSFSGERALQKLDIFWLGDIIYRYLNVAPAIVGMALLAAILYLGLSVFLNGGVIGSLNRPESATLADFFHDGGLYFWRFLRLFLLSIPVYLLFLGIFFPLIKSFLNVFSGRATTEWPALIASNLRFLGLVLLLTVVSMFFDYVKIGLATGGNRKVLPETWRTLKFVGKRFFRAWGLYLLAGLVFIALTLAYLEVARILPKHTPAMVLLVFIWQQAYVFCRQWSKVLFFASEIEFAKQHKEPAK